MDQVRTIEAGAPPARFARGWHCLGLADRFREGGPHAVTAFGTKLVVFAASTSALHGLDASSRHMGCDLSQGTDKSDAISCPFHDWRWGGDGRCAGIPYARRVPVAARTRAWRTLERNGHLFVWNDPEGNAPPDDVTIPVIEGASSDGWTDWTWDSILVEGANCREVIDNVVDMAHFFYIHFAFPTFFKNVFEGHIASQYLQTRSRPDVGGASNYSSGDDGQSTLRSEASYYGPAYMIDYLWHDYHGMGIESVLINCHHPRGGGLGGGGGGQPRAGAAGRCRLTAAGPLRGMSGGPPSAPSSAGGAARVCWPPSSARSTPRCSGARRRCGRVPSSPPLCR